MGITRFDYHTLLLAVVVEGAHRAVASRTEFEMEIDEQAHLVTSAGIEGLHSEAQRSVC